MRAYEKSKAWEEIVISSDKEEESLPSTSKTDGRTLQKFLEPWMKGGGFRFNVTSDNILNLQVMFYNMI